MLVVVCGLPGSGKSEVARLIASKIKATHLQTDVLRKELNFTVKAKRQTYQALFNRAEEELRAGNNVVLDGTFYKESFRTKAKELAKKMKTEVYFVEVVSEEQKIKSRVQDRFKQYKLGKSESPADYKVYLIMKKQWQPIKEKHFVIDNSNDLEDLRSQVENLYSRLTRGGQNNAGKSSG